MNTTKNVLEWLREHDENCAIREGGNVCSCSYKNRPKSYETKKRQFELTQCLCRKFTYGPCLVFKSNQQNKCEVWTDKAGLLTVPLANIHTKTEWVSENDPDVRALKLVYEKTFGKHLNVISGPVDQHYNTEEMIDTFVEVNELNDKQEKVLREVEFYVGSNRAVLDQDLYFRFPTHQLQFDSETIELSHGFYIRRADGVILLSRRGQPYVDLAHIILSPCFNAWVSRRAYFKNGDYFPTRLETPLTILDFASEYIKKYV